MQSNLEVDALLSWLTVLLGHEQTLDLETVVKRSLFVDALRVIGPSYLPADAASRPGLAFDEAVRKFDRAELFFPPDSPLLHVDWQRLVGAEDLSVLGRHEGVKVRPRGNFFFFFFFGVCVLMYVFEGFEDFAWSCCEVQRQGAFCAATSKGSSCSKAKGFDDGYSKRAFERGSRFSGRAIFACACV